MFEVQRLIVPGVDCIAITITLGMFALPGRSAGGIGGKHRLFTGWTGYSFCPDALSRRGEKADSTLCEFYT